MSAWWIIVELAVTQKLLQSPLLLKRHIIWLDNWAVRWFVFFDDMTIPHLPKIVAFFLGRYAWLLLYFGLMVIALCAIYFIYLVILNETTSYGSEVLWAVAVGAAAVVHYFVVRLLGYAAASGRLTLGIICIAASLIALNYLFDPSNQEFDSEPSLLAAVFGYVTLLILFMPIAGYLTILLVLFAMWASFVVFKVTTCHLFELSSEKKTIFSHLGILIGILVAGGKFGLELSKVI